MLGEYCERVDEQVFHENMLDRIYNQIAKSDMIVADMTHKNPNVFYEVGYAHALNKTVILLTQNADDIPFDLRHRAHIVYGSSITALKDSLKRRVKYYLENPKLHRNSSLDFLKYIVEGVDIEVEKLIHLQLDKIEFQFDLEYEDEVAEADSGGDGGEKSEEREVVEKKADGGTWTLKFSVHNSGHEVLKMGHGEMEIGLAFPRALAVPGERYGLAELTVVDKETFLAIKRDIYQNMLPQSYINFDLHLYIKNVYEVLNKEFNLTVKIFTKFGVREMPFNIVY